MSWPLSPGSSPCPHLMPQGAGRNKQPRPTKGPSPEQQQEGEARGPPDSLTPSLPLTGGLGIPHFSAVALGVWEPSPTQADRALGGSWGGEGPTAGAESRAELCRRGSRESRSRRAGGSGLCQALAQHPAAPRAAAQPPSSGSTTCPVPHFLLQRPPPTSSSHPGSRAA